MVENAFPACVCQRSRINREAAASFTANFALDFGIWVNEVLGYIKIVERRVTKMRKSRSSGHSAENAGEVTGVAATAAETKAETLEKRLQKRIRADPIKSTLVAAGAGLLIGILLF